MPTFEHIFPTNAFFQPGCCNDNKALSFHILYPQKRTIK